MIWQQRCGRLGVAHPGLGEHEVEWWRDSIGRKYQFHQPEHICATIQCYFLQEDMEVTSGQTLIVLVCLLLLGQRRPKNKVEIDRYKNLSALQFGIALLSFLSTRSKAMKTKYACRASTDAAERLCSRFPKPDGNPYYRLIDPQALICPTIFIKP